MLPGLIRRLSVVHVSDIAQKTQNEGIDHTALLIIGGVVDPGRKGYTRSYLYS